MNFLNYILWLLELNVLFCIVNLPIIAALMFLDISLLNAPVFLLAGLTLGPALYAMFDSMAVIDKKNALIRHFIKSFAGNCKKVLKMWAPMWAVIVFLVFDLQIINKYTIFSAPRILLIVLICMAVTFAINYFIVWTTWKQNVKDALIMTGKLALVKAGRYNMNFMILLGTALLMRYVPVYLVLYGAAVALFLAYKNFTPVIQFVNDRPENQSEDTEREIYGENKNLQK